MNNGGPLGSAKYCDCNQLNEDSGPTAMKFAGLMCQHESTSMCAASLVGTHSPNHQFCTNHGKCVKLVSDTEPHLDVYAMMGILVIIVRYMSIH